MTAGRPGTSRGKDRLRELLNAAGMPAEIALSMRVRASSIMGRRGLSGARRRVSRMVNLQSLQDLGFRSGIRHGVALPTGSVQFYIEHRSRRASGHVQVSGDCIFYRHNRSRMPVCNNYDYKLGARS